ncbi:paraplegin [Vespa crabro]|uniref:paraplegin n=1 Tax=Vespa crabro TaxID=7445 RepID=UPI001F00984F|nr:paraplegin [Vespa crabro]
MQNLRKCSNRHYFIPYKIINLSSRHDIVFKHGINTIFNLRYINANGNIKLRRLPVLERHHIVNKANKKCGIIQSTLLDYSNNQCKLLSYRNFSTSSSHNKEEDNNKSSKNNDSDPVKYIILSILKIGTVLGFLYFIGKHFLLIPKESTANVSWQEFVQEMLAKGEVEELIVYPSTNVVKINLYPEAIIKGQKLLFRTYTMHIPNIDQIEEKLRKEERKLGIKKENEISVIYNRNSERIMQILRFMSLILFLYALFSKTSVITNFKPFMSKLKSANFTLVEPSMKHGKGVRFEDVAGLKEAKIEVMEFVDYLKQPERYQTLGAKVPKGALLLGPPGCGKTLLAKAVATEANVPFLSMNGSEFIEVLGGLGAARVRDLFKEGKKRAPSIIYIDEIDAIGRKRSESSVHSANDESERTLNQLLVEMDGMISKENIIVLASTNRAEVLDKALLRPGRFDRHILIDLPTLEERKQIFEYHLKKIALQEDASKYSHYLSYLTPGFTGADIANVSNEAALHAARHKKKIVEGSDLMYAIDRTIGGTKKITSTVTPSMKRVIAYHEAGHALVGWLLKYTDALLKVTIVPRTNLSLGFAQYTESDHKLQSKEELHEKMCMMLGGRAAENLIFNQITTGAQNDLEKVTKLAYLQIQQYGMCPTLGLLSFDEESTSQRTKKPYSKQLGNLMDAEARRLIAEAYEKAQQIIVDNRDKLEKIAEALIEKETLNYDDVEKLIGPPPYEKKNLVELAEFVISHQIDESNTVNPTST